MSDRRPLILGSTLRQHIGGRWAISVISVLLVTPLGVAASGANVASVQGRQSLEQWLTLGVVGSLVIIAVLVIANLTFFRNRRSHPVPIWWVVILGVIAGATRSFVVVPLSAELGVIQFSWQEMTIRMISGGAIGAMFLPLGALLSSVIASYISQRRTLLQELSELEIEQMRLSGESEALRTAVLDEVRFELDDVVQSGDAEAARSASHRIWEQSEREPIPRVSWRDVLWATVAHNPYPIVPVAGFWAVTALGTTVVAAGWLAALAQITFSVVCIVVFFRLGRYASDRFPSASLAILALVVIALELTVALAAPLLFQVNPLVDNSAAMAANAIWIPFLVLMVGAVVSAIKSGDDVVAKLRERVATHQAKAAAKVAETARIRKEVAAALHGTVQSQLLAAAAGLSQPRISQLMNRSPREGLEAALAAVDTSKTSEVDFTEHLSRIRRSWGSLMQLSMRGLDEAHTPGQAREVVRVIEEGLANAYRHGGASAVDVEVTRESGGLRVLVIDDGNGVNANSQPGLGSAVLESLAPGAWSLARSADERTVLDVLLRDSQT